MNIAIILAGGVGSRMKSGTTPKQYLLVNGKPVISYCLDIFENSPKIDDIVIVAEKDWHNFLLTWMDKEYIKKFRGFALPGCNRQYSIFHGLQFVKSLGRETDDIVVIHDAARPLLSLALLNACIEHMVDVDGVMPVISMKDTIYVSENHENITGILNRDILYAGQSPECFSFGSYYNANAALSEEEMLSFHGSSEIAYKCGLNVKLISGSEDNFKITTKNDLDLFQMKLNDLNYRERIQ